MVINSYTQRGEGKPGRSKMVTKRAKGEKKLQEMRWMEKEERKRVMRILPSLLPHFSSQCLKLPPSLSKPRPGIRVYLN